MNILLFGSSGHEVETAQAALNFYAGAGDIILRQPVDGKFGQNTHNRTVQFQKQNNLFPDGKIGPNTRAVLFACTNVYVSVAMMQKPSQTQSAVPSASSAVANPAQRQVVIDWSKINLRMVPLWPPPPKFTSPIWPPLNLTLPPLPRLLPGLPAPTPPRLVLNAQLSQGQSLTPPPVFTPFNTPSVKIFALKLQILTKERKNFNVKSEVEPVREDDGTFKLEAFVKTEVDIVDIGIFRASVYLKAKGQGGLSPMTGKVIGSGGLNFDFFRGKFVLGAGTEFLKIDGDKGTIETKLMSIGGTATFFF